MNLQPGDILINKDKEEVKVIAVFASRVWTTNVNDFEHSCGILDTLDELTSYGYTKKETPWTPKDGDEYWCLEDTGEVNKETWYDEDTEMARASFLGVFPTKEAALKRKEEIIKLIRK